MRMDRELFRGWIEGFRLETRDNYHYQWHTMLFVQILDDEVLGKSLIVADKNNNDLALIVSLNDEHVREKLLEVLSHD